MVNRMTYPTTFYVDKLGYRIGYNEGSDELGVVMTGELYHCFNGFMLLGVL